MKKHTVKSGGVLNSCYIYIVANTMAEKVSQFSTAFATAITAILSKRMTFDGATYAAISTIVSIIVSCVAMKMYESFSFSIIENIGYYTIAKCCIALLIGICVYHERWIFKYFFDTIKARRYREIDVVGSYPIEKIMKYMRQYNTFFKIQSGVCLVDLEIDYTKLKTNVFFIDGNYGVSGYLQFSNEQKTVPIQDDSTKSTQQNEQKQQETKTADPNTPAKDGKTDKPSQVQPKPDVNKVTEYVVVKLTRCVCRNKQLCSSGFDYVDKMVKHQYDNDKTYDISHDVYMIQGDAFGIFKTYINTHKSFYQTSSIMITDVGDMTKTIFFPTDLLIYFNDTDKQVSGFIKWMHNSETHNDEIHLKKCSVVDGYSIYKYIDDIKRDITNKKAQRYLTLYNVDKTRNGYESVCSMYDGISLDMNALENRYIATLFHPQIREIWNHIRTINYYPEKISEFGQSPRMNMLLYGPPGTGKSTFAYRIAMATKRHLISVRLSRYSKNEMYKIFTQPSINGSQYKPRDIVFVLDEFDSDFEKILTRGTMEMERIDKIKQVVSTTFVQMERGNHVQTEQQSKQSDPSKQGEQTKKVENEIMEMEKLVKGINSTYDKIEQLKDNIVTLKDLLIIFQGSVPIDGCIIIAMTNNYDIMYEKCPALFRTGRLTPIYFGDFDIDMVNEISKHYFGRCVKCAGDKQKYSVQPVALISKVLEIDLLTKTPDEKYKMFVDFLNREHVMEFA